MSGQETPRTVEEAARAGLVALYGEDYPAPGVVDEDYLIFTAAALAAAAQTVAEVAEVLAVHRGWSGLPSRPGRVAGTYCTCGQRFEGLHATHQAEQVVALWGAL